MFFVRWVITLIIHFSDIAIDHGPSTNGVKSIVKIRDQ